MKQEKKQFEKSTGKKCGKPPKRTGNANPKKRAGKNMEDREENLGQDAPLPLHYICKMLLHVYHHVYLRKWAQNTKLSTKYNQSHSCIKYRTG
jgi:hypothetical protein